MLKNPRLIDLLYRLWPYISVKRRWQFSMLTFLMLIAAFAEVASLGAVVPFLAALVSPDHLFEQAWIKPIILSFQLNEPSQLLLPLTVIFILVVFIAGIIRILLLWFSIRLSFAVGADLSIKIFRNTLYQPYKIHTSRNSSEIINGIFYKTNLVINSVVVSVVTLISSTLIIVSIISALIIAEPFIALVTLGGFGLIYLFVIKLTSKSLRMNSEKVAKESTKVVKSLQEGLGGIRDVIIDGNQDFFSKIFRNADLPLRKAQGDNLFISSFPRYGVETLGTLLIAVVAYSLTTQGGELSNAVPLLGVAALAAQRVLPIIQQAYSSYTNMRAAYQSLKDTIELLEQPMPEHLLDRTRSKIKFQTSIRLVNLKFRYNEGEEEVLNNISLTIKKGTKVGIIGSTGAGKSTLLDIIMGLNYPSSGSLEIDGTRIDKYLSRDWQNNIAHVPQSIYLSDNSILENIAFGIEKEAIDFKKVKRVSKQAQIDSIIEKLPDKYLTIVGERGILLSGGQRQRIGIARALYKDANVIIFDEATSALDNETEKDLMDSINKLSSDLTLILVAHRLSTLSICNQVYKINKNGSLSKVRKNKIIRGKL